MKSILHIDSVELAFDLRKILSSVYMKCETNEIIGLLGLNGQGKTCLLNIIYGSLAPQHKSIRIDHKPIEFAYKSPELLVYLPQFNFIPNNLSIKRIFKDFNTSIDEFVLKFPEFENLTLTKIGNLSGGQRRLIEVYVIIKTKTKFVILDEPFSHIMPIQIEKIKKIIIEEKKIKAL